jgi:hypothetical protein
MTGDLQPLRDILHRALARYLTVRPSGFVLHDDGRPPRRSVEARILGYGGARTLYRDRKPDCRSLDGVASITHTGRRCTGCELRAKCTPQVRLDLIVDYKPYRLLLAQTSARNFLEHEAHLRQAGIAIETIAHRIEVIDRGSWGELRFERGRDAP